MHFILNHKSGNIFGKLPPDFAKRASDFNYIDIGTDLFLYNYNCTSPTRLRQSTVIWFIRSDVIYRYVIV
jgi:hypothetical protein